MAFVVKKKNKDLALPLDSFSDIAFLLIIFFILTTQIQKLTGFRTELPAGEKSQAETTEKTPTVGLTANQITFNEQAITIDQLAAELKALNLKAKPPAGRVVLLDASDDVDYQCYFEVMSLITAADGAIGILKEVD